VKIPQKYWKLLNELVQSSDIVIERPKGTTHPRYPDLRYPLDYGYIKNTNSSDHDAVDVWIGSLNPRDICGIVCTVDIDNRDVEIKLLLGCTAEETQTVLDIHNKGKQAAFTIKPAI
jgi:inorganic pyrophosphatase